jgi:hypothetical protein
MRALRKLGLPVVVMPSAVLEKCLVRTAMEFEGMFIFFAPKLCHSNRPFSRGLEDSG